MSFTPKKFTLSDIQSEIFLKYKDAGKYNHEEKKNQPIKTDLALT